MYCAIKLASPAMPEILIGPTLLLVTLIYSTANVSVEAPEVRELVLFSASTSITGSEPEQEADMVGVIL